MSFHFAIAKRCSSDNTQANACRVFISCKPSTAGCVYQLPFDQECFFAMSSVFYSLYAVLWGDEMHPKSHCLHKHTINMFSVYRVKGIVCLATLVEMC